MIISDITVVEVIRHQVARSKKIAKIALDVGGDRHSDFANGIHSAADQIASELADVMEQDNPQFKRDAFMRACGLE